MVLVMTFSNRLEVHKLLAGMYLELLELELLVVGLDCNSRCCCNCNHHKVELGLGYMGLLVLGYRVQLLVLGCSYNCCYHNLLVVTKY